jgi:hypothetical protein
VTRARCYPAGMAYTPAQLAMLEAQRAHFASDDHIRREVAVWSDATPTERLAELAAMCRAAAHYLRLHPGSPDPGIEQRYPPDTLALWTELRRTAR